jgi:5-oxopent-3-ene-1,2,5-tricarboxylate decarboxylase/2-hydroxyhepta-2,4-diene-1,7-dioate isomerase
VVVGALLNHEAEWAALGAAAEAPPYKGRARAPVLQVKPRGALVGDGAAVEVPGGVAALELGLTLAIVIGRTACRVAAAEAGSVIAGYRVACDIRIPQPGPQEHYRPGVRLRARDGFCPVGSAFAPASSVSDPDALACRVALDGAEVQRTHTGGRVRGVARLIEEVTEFMTLAPGDLLLLGSAPGAPLARAGQSALLAIEGVGTLGFALVAEALEP